MKYRNVGTSGLEVSVVGLGCMNFGLANDEAESVRITHRALDLGINFFDTADVYGQRGRSETWLGKALGTRRNEVVVATKFAGPMSDERRDLQGGSRRYIMHAVEASLRRLGTDYIDLYQMHRFDGATPLDETLRALDDLVRQGKVRYVGSSNYDAWQVGDADWIARDLGVHRFISAQNRYSLLSRAVERELVPACRRYGLGLVPYFPLESGLLTGKYRPGEAWPEGSRLARWGGWAAGAFANDENLARVARLAQLCDEHGCSMLELAMGWLAARPAVASVIAGVTSVEQLEQNVAAGLFEPSAALAEAVDDISPPPDTGFGARG